MVIHMAIVSRASVEKAASVKKVAKRSLEYIQYKSTHNTVYCLSENYDELGCELGTK
jgi:hypothetical protein